MTMKKPLIFLSIAIGGALAILGFWRYANSSAETIAPSGDTSTLEIAQGPSFDRALDPGDASGPENSSASESSLDVRASVRRRADEERRRFSLPQNAPLRSPTGAVDSLQCVADEVGCESDDPMAAESWPEAQWMRERGFVDEQQLAAAQRLSDSELDSRYQAGDPAAVLELARRFSVNGEEIEARTLLRDAVSRGNVRAAHELARSESQIRSAHSRPGLQWLFVARRMGDGRVTLSYMRSQFPNLQDREIDHAMLVADRYSHELGLLSRPVQTRPERP